MKIDEIKTNCLNCINMPCRNKGCPLENNIPQFIHEDNTEKAFEILCKTTVLPAICGRICPHSKQCQGLCTRGIKGTPVKIGVVESYIGDISLKENYKILKNNITKYNNKKVAIIGGGPAGITCAAFLAKEGAQPTIYEKHNTLGGILSYGIPDFRLEKSIVKDTISKIIELGVKVESNKELGKDFSIKELLKIYDAVFIAIGANEPQITLKGSNVLSGNTLLEHISMKKYNEPDNNINYTKMTKNFKNKEIIVSGGGNVAIDVARTIKRLDAKVRIIYRRSEEEMPAEKSEIEIAKKEGIEFLFKNNILFVDSKNNEIECIKTELVKNEGERRLSPVNIEGTNYKMNADYIILATGSKTNNELLEKQGLKINKYGYVIVDEDYKTSINNVFAGGDIIGTKATVAWASKNGREAAYSIIKNFK